MRATLAVYPDGVGRAHQDHAKRLCALVELMLHTGLRIGDAVRLKRDSIVAGKVRLRTTKTGTEVCCPLPPSVIKKLEAVRGTSKEYFLWTGISKPKSVIGDWLGIPAKVIGIPG